MQIGLRCKCAKICFGSLTIENLKHISILFGKFSVCLFWDTDGDGDFDNGGDGQQQDDYITLQQVLEEDIDAQG